MHQSAFVLLRIYRMLKDFSAPALTMGLLTAFVGFASSFAVVMQGLQALGASPGQIASALLALCIAEGVLAIVFSALWRMPISIAWSTPGAALLASTGAIEGGFAAAVGAFIVCALLIALCGLFSPLGRAVRMIPGALANAMLAGILLGLCLAPVRAVAENAALGLPIVLAWAVMAMRWRLFAVPAALLAFVLVLVFGVGLPAETLSRIGEGIRPQLDFVAPVFNRDGLVLIALPLFIVTMASQNIPGIAILRANGYEPRPGPLFAATGSASVFTALFGGIPVNMAAITAALCASSDAHPDPARRYWAGIIGGFGYIALGLVAGGIIALVSLSPPILLQAVAGLALIGAFSGAAFAAWHDIRTREAAAVCFLVTASGVSFAGISGAFWGLVAGGGLMALQRLLAPAAKD